MATSRGLEDDVFEIEQPGGNALVINSPELVHQVLVTDAEHFSKGPVQQGMFRNLLGDSVSMVEGDAHTRQRRLLGPLFNRDQANNAVPAIVKTFEHTADAWAKEPEIDLFAELNDLTIRSVGINLITEPHIWDDGPFWVARRRIWQRMNDLALHEVPKSQHLDATDTYPVDDDVEYLRGFVSGLLLKRMREPTNDVLSGLAALVRQGRLSGAQAIDQLIALLLAAHETNAGALYWALLLLDSHPDWMRRVITELDIVLENHEPQYSDIDRLILTRAVIFESLRLYPPAARQFRIATKDVQVGQYEIQTGTPVFISHVALHSHPSLFEDPQVFEPSRWIGLSRTHEGFMPFGLGRHRCLGRHYAQHELVVLLALIIQHLTVAFPADVDLSTSLAIALRPAVPARVTVSRRHP